MIGGIAETQEVIDYCAARDIKADVELIRPKRSTGVGPGREEGRAIPVRHRRRLFEETLALGRANK